MLGFGGHKHDNYRPQLEVSAAYLLTKKVAIGAECHINSDNLCSSLNPALAPLTGSSNSINLKEDDAFDVFVANATTKNFSFTAANVNLGNIATVDAVGADFGKQEDIYLSAQVGF